MSSSKEDTAPPFEKHTGPSDLFESVPDLSATATDNGSVSLEDHTLKPRPWLVRTTPWASIVGHDYKGAGTEAEPYIVSWLPDDPEDPMNYKDSYKWFITMMAATGTLAVSMGSSMLSAAIEDIKADFPGHNTMLYIMVTGECVLRAAALTPQASTSSASSSARWRGPHAARCSAGAPCSSSRTCRSRRSTRGRVARRT